MPLRVLEMIDRPMLGGGQLHVYTLAKGLDPGRFEVTVCSAAGGPLVEKLETAGIRHVAFPLTKRPSPRAVFALRRLIRESEADVLHTHGGVAGLWGRLASAGLRGLARVHTIHGIHYLNYRLRSARLAMVALERALGLMTHRVICVCRSNRRQAVAAGAVARDRVAVVLNGIDLAPYRTPCDGVPVRRELGLEDDSLLFGTVGRLDFPKGQVHLLDAFAHVIASVPRARLVIAGAGDLESSLTARAGRLGVTGAVSFLGARDDVPRLLAAMDVFVLPSIWEGLSLTLMEAAAAGRPIVATSVDGNVELVQDGVTGCLVPPADPAALADAMTRLARDPAERARLGEAARAHALAEFSHTRMVAELSAIYEAVSRRSGPGDLHPADSPCLPAGGWRKPPA